MATAGTRASGRGETGASRRQVLVGGLRAGALTLGVGAAGWATVACDTAEHPNRRSAGPAASATVAPSTPPAPDPDTDVLSGAYGDERSLVDRYTGTAHRHPGLRGLLKPVLDHHRQHLAVVQGLLEAARRGPLPTPLPTDSTVTSPSASASRPASASASASRAGTPTSGGSPVTPPHIPTKPGNAVAALQAAEDRAAERRRADVGVVRSGELARLLASIAACETLHPDLLERPDRAQR